MLNSRNTSSFNWVRRSAGTASLFNITTVLCSSFSTIKYLVLLPFTAYIYAGCTAYARKCVWVWPVDSWFTVAVTIKGCSLALSDKPILKRHNIIESEHSAEGGLDFQTSTKIAHCYTVNTFISFMMRVATV